jgi:hypothetical protein
VLGSATFVTATQVAGHIAPSQDRVAVFELADTLAIAAADGAGGNERRCCCRGNGGRRRRRGAQTGSRRAHPRRRSPSRPVATL